MGKWIAGELEIWEKHIAPMLHPSNMPLSTRDKNMKAISIVVALFLCLLAGCSTGKQEGNSRESRKTDITDINDDFKIEMAVYGYMLEKHPWDSGEYAAIFIEGGDDRVAALIRKFPHHVPSIKPGDRMQRSPNQAPIDKDTGKFGLILSAKAVGPTNGVSEAIGTWYAGEAASGLYAFVLVEVDGEWTIQSVQ
jgi:hypothetical protein